MHIMKTLFVVIVCLVNCSCSIVNIDHDGKQVDFKRKFGFVNVVTLNQSNAIVDTKFLGVGVTNGDFIAGFKSSKDVILSTDECVVFITENSQIDSDVLTQLKEVGCKFIYEKD